MTITDADITRQVTASIEANGSQLAEGIDIEGVVRELIMTHGLEEALDIDDDTFWAVVARHDATQQ